MAQVQKHKFSLENAYEKLEKNYGEHQSAYVLVKKGYLERIDPKEAMKNYHLGKDVEFWWIGEDSDGFRLESKEGKVSWFGPEESDVWKRKFPRSKLYDDLSEWDLHNLADSLYIEPK